MSCGSLVYRAPALARVLRHMWDEVHPPQFSNEFLGVVILVTSQGHALSGWGLRPIHPRASEGRCPLACGESVGVSGGRGCLNCSAAPRAPGNQLRLGVLGKSNPIFSTMLLQKVDDRSIGITA